MDLDFLLGGMPAKAWYNLREATALKGISYKSALNKPWLKPNGGVADAVIGGRNCWSRDTVLKWINLTDKELEPEVPCA